MAIYSAFSGWGVALLSVKYEVSRQEYVLHCKKDGQRRWAKTLSQIPMASECVQRALMEGHSKHQSPSTAETCPLFHVTSHGLNVIDLFKLLLPPLSHLTLLLRFGHSAPLSSGMG